MKLKDLIGLETAPEPLPGTVSLRTAINAKCRECIYDPMVPGRWRQQVAACTVVRCPLWPVRPKSAADPVAPATAVPAPFFPRKETA